MAETVILEKQEISGFSTAEAQVEASNPLVAGKAYTISWEGESYSCVAYTLSVNGMDIVGVGNQERVEWLITGGAGDAPTAVEPFSIVMFPAAMTGSTDMLSFNCEDANCASDSHTVAIYLVEEDSGETHAPNAAVILNYSQTPVNYEAVPKVWLTHPDSTEDAPVLVPFTYGELVEGTVITPDFSAGDMAISVPDGSLVKEATILKPETLTPENIRQGVDIGGVKGEFLGDTEEAEVELSMAGGDQVILPSADGKSLFKVTVKKPDTLIPANIAKDVEIGGVVGTHEGGSTVNGEEVTVELSMADGDQVVTPSEDGGVMSKVTIQKPETLIPENIAEGVDIAGIVGTLVAGGNAELLDNIIKGTTTAITTNATYVRQYAFYYYPTAFSFSCPLATEIKYNAFNYSKVKSIHAPLAKYIGAASLQQCTSLQELILPSAVSFGTNSLNKCTALKKLDLGTTQSSIASGAFGSCTALVTLILRYDGVSKYWANWCASTTPIGKGTGYIYVPATHLESYKSSEGWSTYAAQFRTIEDYPDICG